MKEQAKINNLTFAQKVKKDFQRNKWIYFIVLPVLIYLILFCYKPMYGIVIAFKDYRPRRGISGSEWVGLKHFITLFRDQYFYRALKNTFVLSVLQIVFSFPMPIIFALLINEVRVKWFKKTIQTVSYMPHFISMVVICSMVTSFCRSTGAVNDIIEFFGGNRTNLLGISSLFYPIYIISDIWQGLGWNSIIYLAALAGIDQEQYEAAKIDGASRLQQMRFITLPGLVPTISMLLVLRMGNILNVGFEKVLLLYQPTTYEVADIISTYVYRRGLIDADFSYSTAVGLFNSVVNLFFLTFTNKLSKRMGQSGLF